MLERISAKLSRKSLNRELLYRKPTMTIANVVTGESKGK